MSRVQSPACLRIELCVAFFRPTDRGPGRQAVGLVSRRFMGHLRSFHRIAMRSSSAHEGKIIIFEISMFLDKNYTVKLTIGKINQKIEICSI